jgi:hypothetical protein
MQYRIQRSSMNIFVARIFLYYTSQRNNVPKMYKYYFGNIFLWKYVKNRNQIDALTRIIIVTLLPPNNILEFLVHQQWMRTRPLWCTSNDLYRQNSAAHKFMSSSVGVFLFAQWHFRSVAQKGTTPDRHNTPKTYSFPCWDGPVGCVTRFLGCF